MIFPVIEGFNEFSEIDLPEDSKGEYVKRFNAAENKIGMLKLETLVCPYPKANSREETVIVLKVFVAMNFLSTIKAKGLEPSFKPMRPYFGVMQKELKEKNGEGCSFDLKYRRFSYLSVYPRRFPGFLPRPRFPDSYYFNPLHFSQPCTVVFPTGDVRPMRLTLKKVRRGIWRRLYRWMNPFKEGDLVVCPSCQGSRLGRGYPIYTCRVCVGKGVVEILWGVSIRPEHWAPCQRMGNQGYYYILVGDIKNFDPGKAREQHD